MGRTDFRVVPTDPVSQRSAAPRHTTAPRHNRPALGRRNLANQVLPIALTFDDGPNPEWTPRVCDALAERAITATFFIWGEQAARHPDVVREVLGRGHRVQPHCWAHTSHLEMTPKQIAADIDRVLEFLGELGAPAPELWRPPWGHLQGGTTEAIAGDRGLELAGWTINTTDYEGTSASQMHTMIVDRISGVAESPVILMHDNYLEPGQRRSDAAETVELVGLLGADHDRSFIPLAHGLRPGLDEQPKRSAVWLRRVGGRRRRGSGRRR
jgi:peptidoglycan-N-acetylglucosamine deacetylase